MPLRELTRSQHDYSQKHVDSIYTLDARPGLETHCASVPAKICTVFKKIAMAAGEINSPGTRSVLSDLQRELTVLPGPLLW